MNFEQIPMLVLTIVGIVVFILIAFLTALSKFYKKVDQGRALVRNGIGGQKVSFGGIWVVPIIHKCEEMDISVKRIETDRRGPDGLLCQDNIRADIKVAFFVRVNHRAEDVLKVAQSLGCIKASDHKTMEAFFDAKFSEALKTVGKKFDFVQLYTERNKFKEEILQVIGTDLNGFVLDDAAIDYLEQTSIEHLSKDNILDVEGFKKITEITAREMIKANQIQRDKEKTIEQQDVQAKEAIYELQRQQTEAQEKQIREIATIKSREQAEAQKIASEEKLKAERARITTEEEIAIAEENKNRQIIVAQKARERVELVEAERVDKDRLVEKTEKEKIVTLAEIAKERAVEEERKNIQSVIRERVVVEKETVVEQQRIKDTEAFAAADRQKKVTLTQAEEAALANQVKELVAAETSKKAAQQICEQQILEADAKLRASEKDAEARKIIADVRASEEAVGGMAEVRIMEARAKAIELEGGAKVKVLEMNFTTEAKGIEVKAAAEAKGIELKIVAESKGLEAKAVALEKQGTAEANVLELKGVAEAKGLEAKASAVEKQGAAEAHVLELKGLAEAKGIEAKVLAEAKGGEAMATAIEKKGAAEASVLSKRYSAEALGIKEKSDAMKNFDGPGRDHEEFKLKLDKDKVVEIASIETQAKIADAQSAVIQEALKSAKIDIVGGETMFFDKVIGSIVQGKSVDKLVNNSAVLTDVKRTFVNGDGDYFKHQIKEFVAKFNLSSGDLKNLTVSALLMKLLSLSKGEEKGMLQGILSTVEKLGIGSKPAESIINM
jgi:uncharacterized membrane protein YqiK